MATHIGRELPIGAEIVNDGVHFRVWAPRCARVGVMLEKGEKAVPLTREDGYFSGLVRGAGDGTRYRFCLDGGDSLPDPASRQQPDGPHGDSQVVDPRRFAWTDAEWQGVAIKGQVLYEMHVGTFTAAGTFAAATEQFGELVDLGVTVIEVMPIADFPGRFGWGYDGVALFAPFHGYGTPDDFRGFVNLAHGHGLGVILDVVYNHFGPDGNYLRHFSDSYFTSRHRTDWGDAINYDGPHSGPVREFMVANARHWIAEYHLDGLRLDATDYIHDDSDTHILAEVAAEARLAARRGVGGTRTVLIVGENESQDASLFRPRAEGGKELDMLWSDDFHHTALVAATGRREAYYTDYRGSAQEFVSAVKHGYLYQGQHYAWQKHRRGTAAWDVAAYRFIHYLENHDQVANTRDGRRLHELTSPGRYRALTALTLLGPETPLLFQGQEFGSTAPFLYFADHNPELAKLVRQGRGKFLSQFPSIGGDRAAVPDPADPRTFERSRLNDAERARGRQHRDLHRDLLVLRRCDPVLSGGASRIDGAVIGDAGPGAGGTAFVIRFFAENGSDRLLVVNLGADLALDVAPEPLLAPPDRDRGWQRIWHSEDPRYGGRGATQPESENGSWRLPAESATLLAAHDE